MAGASEFIIQVDETPDGITCDQADWADAKATLLVGEISPDDANGTFTFTVNVTPQNPLTF